MDNVKLINERFRQITIAYRLAYETRGLGELVNIVLN
jgi:hypothetical protein